MKHLNRLLDSIIVRVPQPLWLVLACVAACLILYMGMRPGDELRTVSRLPRGFDKVMHFTAFAAMAACLFRGIFPLSIRRPPLIPSPWCWLAVVALPAVVGAMDEFFQSMTPNRSSDPMDWVADTAAGVFVVVLGWLHRRH